MLKKNNQPQHIRIAKLLLVPGLALLFTFIFFFSPLGLGLASAHAQQNKQLSDGPSILSVKAGFNGTYRVGNWIPIQVKVNNNGGAFDGIISVSLSTVYTGGTSSPRSISLYQTAISLPAISQKQITMYVPIEVATGAQGAPNSLTIHLQDNNNNEVTRKSVAISNVASNELYIGLISDQSLDVRQLTGALSGQNAHPHIEPLSASALPTSVEAFNNFDLLVFDNAVTSTLSNDQRTALQGWVNQGGTIVEVGGPEWHTTLGSLPPSLLPVTITGTDTVAAGQHLLLQPMTNIDNNAIDDTLPTNVPISVATVKTGSLVLLTSNNIPLIVQDNIGQGQVYYLAYDPFLGPMVTWTNTSNLWTNLFMRTFGDQILTIDNGNSAYNGASTSKYNLYGTMNNFLQTLVPNAFPSIWLILTLLISYVLILGPLRFLLIRWTKKKAWSWRIVLATIVIFSLLSYSLALQVKGTSVVSSTVSVIQLSQPDNTGSQAHITDYIGVYVPSQGDFHVHIPGVSHVEATDQSSPYGFNVVPGIQPGGQSSSEQTVITSQAANTDVDLQGVDTWTLRTLTSKHDTHIHGGITSNLSFSQNMITGTVTNTLPYTLNDAYILAGGDYIALGTLESGHTQPVQLTVHNQIGNQNNGGSSTLADQIANSKGVNTNQYSNPFMLNSTGQSTNENYRHAAMLEALNGGNCTIGPCIKSYGGPQFIQPHLLDGPERGYTQDPLLVTGAPATIIGWIDNTSNTNSITINNSTVSGTQESLIQAPLNLRFTGKVDVPTVLSTGQIIDVQPGPNSSNLPQEVGSNAYNLTTGSITFELQLPVTSNLQQSSLTFSDATVTSKGGYINPGQAQGITGDANTMNIGLYNWQTNTWDSETFNANTFTVDDAQHYIGPNGRILIRLENGQNSQTTVSFTMPGVELNATIAS